MKITLDTNILIRILVNDDVRQTQAATSIISKATLIAIPLPALCEAAWVLSTRYRISKQEIAAGLERLVSLTYVITDIAAVNKGLDFLRAGGDFADGVIAFQGQSFGGDLFISFDAKARQLWQKAGGIAFEPEQP